MVEVYWRFKGACCLHHQGDRRADGRSKHLWIRAIALMMEAESTCETSANFYQFARFNITEDSYLFTRRLENLRCHKRRLLSQFTLSLFSLCKSRISKFRLQFPWKTRETKRWCKWVMQDATYRGTCNWGRVATGVTVVYESDYVRLGTKFGWHKQEHRMQIFLCERVCHCSKEWHLEERAVRRKNLKWRSY
jgi:hypothetical protein